MLLRTLLPLILATAGCMDADGLLFNGHPVAAYELPGNNIPAEQLEAISFDSGGKTLAGFWVKAGDDANKLNQTILFYHGNRKNIDEYWADVMALHATGADVMVFDYRGYGKSTGELTSTAELEADAAAALAFVHGRGIADADLTLFGYSLGTYATLSVAKSHAAFRAIFLQAGFSTMQSIVQASVFAPVPDGWLNSDTFDNISRVGAVGAPLMVIHGTEDATFRFEDHGQALYDKAPDPKRLLLIPNCTHNDIPAAMGESAYTAAVRAWMTL